MGLLNCGSAGIQIAGWGSYLPQQIIDNPTLIAEGKLPVDPAWIERRIGVKTRHRAAPEQNTSDLALAAARQALQNAQIEAEAIDLILLSTISPDHPNPATACAVQAGLGLRGCPSFDISAACSGFVYGLDVAARYLMTGSQTVLLVSAEIRSRCVNPEDPSTAPIFGDGAGAVILRKVPGSNNLLGTQILADGAGYHGVKIPAGGTAQPASLQSVQDKQHYLQIPQGEQIFFAVVEGMTEQTPLFLESLGMSIEQIDFVIPHQANINILNEVARRLQIPAEKMLIHLDQVGNTSSASIPLAYCHYTDQIPTGSKVLLITAGAGYTMGLALIQT